MAREARREVERNVTNEAGATNLSATRRARELVRLRATAQAPLDVLVIGGGVTGAGIALDAAARGYRVGLIERGDLATGTSSRSTKLAHGGIRYLPQLDVALVREALIERGLLLRNAAHLTRPLAFVLPLYESSRRPVGLPVAPPFGLGLPLILDLGLTLYDLLAGRLSIGAHRRIRRDDVLARAPSLRAEGLTTGFLYYDAQTDDARLTLALARSAAARGALLATYCEATRFLHDAGGRVVGALARQTGASETDAPAFPIYARHVVNATGVWAEQTARLDGDAPALHVQPSKGTHLVFARETLGVGEEAVVLPETEDGRVIFIVPWGARALVGTTDDATPTLDEPVAGDDEIDYLLAHLNRSLARPVSRADIIATYAGYRPLLKMNAARSSARLSRAHAIVEDANGLLTISGGKLTTYRRMAQDTLDRIDAREGRARRHPTRRIRLAGAEGLADAAPQIRRRASALGLDTESTLHLEHAYGADALAVLALVEGDARLGRRLVAELPNLRAEIVYACRAELALTLEDALARRTRLLIEDRAHGLAIAEDVATLMAAELGWSVAERARQLDAYRRFVGAQMAALEAGREADTISAPIASRV